MDSGIIADMCKEKKKCCDQSKRDKPGFDIDCQQPKLIPHSALKTASKAYISG